MADLTFDFDWEDDVGVFDGFELRVNEGFIQVEDKGLSADFVLSGWANEEISFWCWRLFDDLLLMSALGHGRLVLALMDLGNQLAGKVVLLLNGGFFCLLLLLFSLPLLMLHFLLCSNILTFLSLLLYELHLLILILQIDLCDIFL